MDLPYARRLAGVAAVATLAACSSSTPPPMMIALPSDASASDPLWCGRGTNVMGATPATGFCLKSYAQIGEARTMVLAPNGNLFVGAPSDSAPGGASGGPAAIVLLSDDDHDGVAEEHLFLTELDAMHTKLHEVHGLALGGGYLFFTMKASVWRVPYATGDRVATALPENLNLPATYATGGRFTHGLARSVGGQLYTSRGAYGECSMTPESGEISTIGADGTLTTIAGGFRNPMYLRCHRTDEVCAAMELGEDLMTGAREKMLILQPNTNYGYPCCYSKAVASPDGASMSCGDVAKEDASFPLSDTPFGFDWEPGMWPAPYGNGVFVALHGSAYSSPQWQGAAVVFAPTDPTTHVPVQDWQIFQGGFGVGGSVLDRPSDIAFSNDGRMFISDDTSGNIFWMAPTTLAVH